MAMRIVTDKVCGETFFTITETEFKTLKEVSDEIRRLAQYKDGIGFIARDIEEIISNIKCRNEILSKQ